MKYRLPRVRPSTGIAGSRRQTKKRMSKLHWADVHKYASATAAAGDLHSDVCVSDLSSGTADTRALAPPRESCYTRTHTLSAVAAAASNKTNGTAACTQISPLFANLDVQRTCDEGRSYPGRVRRTRAHYLEHIHNT